MINSTVIKSEKKIAEIFFQFFFRYFILFVFFICLSFFDLPISFGVDTAFLEQIHHKIDFSFILIVNYFIKLHNIRVGLCKFFNNLAKIHDHNGIFPIFHTILLRIATSFSIRLQALFVLSSFLFFNLSLLMILTAQYFFELVSITCFTLPKLPLMKREKINNQ